MRHRETIVMPRADWMLIRIHYVRVLVPLATVCLGAILTLLGTAHVMMRLRGFAVDESLPDGLDRIAITIAALVALPVGAGVFSRPFKEQHVLLFHSLPVSRLRQWALFATSSLLALLTVYAGMAMIRPGAVEMLTRSNALAIFTMIVAITFAAGLCFAMVFVRTFAVYLSAYVASILVPLFLCLSLFAPRMSYYRVPPDLSGARFLVEVIELPRELTSTVMWSWAFALAIAFAAASAWFYVRGEMALPRVQMRNALTLLAGTGILIALAAPLMYVWPPGHRTVGENTVLPGGRVAVVRHQNLAAPWLSDLMVIDLATGASTTFDVPGLREWAPARDGQLATWIRDSSPLRRLMYLRDAHDRIERWSLDGRKLGADVYDGEILAWNPDPERGAVVVDTGDVARVFETRRGVRTRELFQAPVPDDAWTYRDFLMFTWVTRESRVWQLGADGPRELQRAPVAADNSSMTAFEGVFYPRRDAVVRKIEETWPVPRTATERVGYVFTFEGRWVWAYVVEPSTLTATLWRLDLPTKKWTRVGEGIPVAQNEVPPAQPGHYGLQTANSMAFHWTTGNALFTERVDGRLRHRLHDLARGTTVTILERAPGDERRLTMRWHALASPRDAKVVSIYDRFTPVAELLWHEGRLTTFPRRPGDFVLAVWPDGTQVRSNGVAYMVTDSRGTVREIPLAHRK